MSNSITISLTVSWYQPATMSSAVNEKAGFALLWAFLTPSSWLHRIRQEVHGTFRSRACTEQLMACEGLCDAV